MHSQRKSPERRERDAQPCRRRAVSTPYAGPIDGGPSRRRGARYSRADPLLRPRQEVAIGGWQESDKQGRSLKSLLLGYYDRGGRLMFAGKAGTGFSLKLGRELVERMRKIERPSPPFAAVPRDDIRGSRWAEPRLVAEIAH